MDFDDARRMAPTFPGAAESTWFGLPTFKVRSKFFAGPGKDGASPVLRCNVYARKYLMEAAPDVDHVTDHHRDDPYVLVHLSAIEPGALRERIEASWRWPRPGSSSRSGRRAASPRDPSSDPRRMPFVPSPTLVPVGCR